jgi:hypothetical protein
MKQPSRRRLLAATGAAAASFSLAGCSSDSGDGDGTPTDTEPSETDQPTTDGATTDEGADTDGSGESVGSDQLRQWVPVAEALETDVQASVLYEADMAAVTASTADFYEGTYDRIARTLLGPNLAEVVPADDRGRVVQIATAATVLLGTTMSDDELGTALTDAGLSESGSQGDATLYEGSLNGSSTTTAVVDSTVVQSFGPNATDTVETVLDARAGEVARLVPNVDEIETLYERLGDAALTVVSERGEDTPSGDPSLDGATALGYGWAFGADNTELTLAITYDDETSPDASAVASYFGDQGGFSDYRSVAGSVEGQLVLVTGSIATDEFDLLSAGTPGESDGADSEPPQVQFDFLFEDGTMTLTHDGGDALQASNLTLRVGDSQAGSQFADEYEEVTAGDSITVDISGVDSGTQVALIWSDGQQGAVLARAQVP